LKALALMGGYSAHLLSTVLTKVVDALVCLLLASRTLLSLRE